jgi:hypothetical protein
VVGYLMLRFGPTPKPQVEPTSESASSTA